MEPWKGMTDQLSLFVEEAGVGVAVLRRQAPIPDGVQLDLSAGGRRKGQTLLLLARRAGYPGSALLPPKPDARLEVLGPCEVCIQVSRTAATTGSQVITASHSAVTAKDVAGRDTSGRSSGPSATVDAVPVRVDGASAFIGRPLPPGDEVPSASGSIQTSPGSACGLVSHLRSAPGVRFIPARKCANAWRCWPRRGRHGRRPGSACRPSRRGGARDRG